MSQMETAPKGPERRGRIHFPDFAVVVEFTLEIAETGRAADELAARVREALSEEFAKCDPLLASLYRLEIVETEIWQGSRKSRNRGTLKKREARGWKEKARIFGAVATLSLTLLSTDYSKVAQNFQTACQKVEKTYNVVITDVRTAPPNFRPASP